ncbi:MAG TPA: YiiX/YebB-like N1pC/P60 family cysteine hydrolase [Planctomycetaceae bacterium]
MSLRPALRQSGAAANALTRSWQKQILKRGRDGDWLIIRGYNSTGHLVAAAGNAELSHVGILDATNAEVIEAVSPAVSEISLHAFLEEADRVVLIRPAEADRASGRMALANARSQIGAPYDLLGTMGLPEAGKFYCSELAAWSVGMEVDREGPGAVLHPAAMTEYGEVLFDSDLGGSRFAYPTGRVRR